MTQSRKVMLNDLAILLSISFLFYFLFLGSYALLSPDEGRYASIALEMLKRGEWIIPYQNGTLFMDKPILFYWLQIISMKLFGINEWAVRLVPMCFGVVGILITYIAGVRLFNRRTALVASFILMTAPLYFLLAHYVNMDLAVAVLISSALWFALMALHCLNYGQRRFYCYLSYIFSGLAVLTKGLIGIVFPVIIVGLWMIIFNQWHQLKKIYLPTGVMIILVINLPWYIAIQHFNSNFFHCFFIVQHIDRYIVSEFNMQHPFYYYGIILCVGFFPWVVFFPQVITFIAKRLYAYKQSSIEWFLVLWIIVIFLFFSIPASKVSSYILPIFPPIAMIVARYFDHYWPCLFSRKSVRVSLITLLGFMLILSIAIIIMLVKPLMNIPMPPNAILIGTVAFLVLMSIIGYSIIRYKNRSMPLSFFIFFIMAMMLFLLIPYSQMKYWSPQITKDVAVQMRKSLRPSAIPVIFSNVYNPTFPFYVRQPLYIVSQRWHSSAILHADTVSAELAKGASFSGNYKYLINEQQLRSLWIAPKRVVLCISENDLLAFEQIINHKPYKVIAKINRFYLLTQK